VATCPGSLIVHADGTTAGCTEDDERGGCAGASDVTTAHRCDASSGTAMAATSAAFTSTRV